jgi:hypothetical protein
LFLGLPSEQRQARALRVILGEHALTLGDECVRDFGLPPHQPLDRGVMLGEHPVIFVPDGTGDDQRCPGFVDEHRVDFVDDGEPVLSLDPLLQRDHHVVAQVIEPELVVRPVRDVALVGRAPFK